jgi:hypothetical protein
MTDLEFEQALREPGPRMEHLLAKIKDRLAQGESKADVLSALQSYRQELIGAGRDEDEDIVLEVMDFVVGWASPHMQL